MEGKRCMHILSKFRECEDPDLGSYEGEHLATINREGLLKIAEKRELSLLSICRLGGIDPSRENICKLLQFDIDLKCADEQAGPSVAKKTKVGSNMMTKLEEKIAALERQVQEKTKADQLSEVDRAKRDAKEEATKGDTCNIEGQFNPRPWESDVSYPFDPMTENIRCKRWVDLHGQPTDVSQVHDVPTAEQVFHQATRGNIPDIQRIPFADPKQFVAGQIHNELEQWRIILRHSPDSETIWEWLTGGVDIRLFIIHFKGRFWGKDYDHDFPPPRMFNNANVCKSFVPFINDTIVERLRNGSIDCVGKVGEVIPPHIVSPLTVEPSKPRLCINLMYLNNWIKNVPFTLDTLKDIPRSVDREAYFTSMDDKSGFDNVFLSTTSFDLVGFQWGGYFYRFRTLCFGFKLSSYIYHTINLQPTSYIRRYFSIPIFLYIDDRLIEEVRANRLTSGFDCAILANYIVSQMMVRLGYCLNLDKSVFIPTQTPVHLGFVIDSVNSCFRLTAEKRSKFAALRDSCLLLPSITVLDLQKLAGRCVSFMLAVPAAKLYTREMNAAISQGLRSKCKVPVSGFLREELEFWKFLDTWSGKLAWKRERHITLSLHSDASLFKWGGVVYLPEGKVEVSDFWLEAEKYLPIMVLEAKALLNVLKSVAVHISKHRVDANVDNQVLINAWNNEGSKSRDLNVVLKDIFQFVLDYDITLNLYFIPSESNQADAPSRLLLKNDATLSRPAWDSIQQRYGGPQGHTLDLMALDSNSMADKGGNPLRHFTPFSTPASGGVNMFCQHIDQKENCYVFPPFGLIAPVIRFILENGLQCSIVLPAANSTPLWMPAILVFILDAFVLGFKGQKGILKYPSKKGFVSDRYGLPWNLWVARISSRASSMQRYGKLLFTMCPGISSMRSLVCVGDSIVRFLQTDHTFVSPDVHVVSLGGALLCQIIPQIERSVREYPPKVLFLHAGINNLSKAFLYENEYEQILQAQRELAALERSVIKCQSYNPQMTVILSSLLLTKDGFVNARSCILNADIKACCLRHNWNFMANDAIHEYHLRDDVHLNSLGERKFLECLMNIVEVSLRQ